MAANEAMALTNAVLTAGSLGCLWRGWRAVKRKDIERHKRWMLGASALGAAFLVVFVARFYLYGMTEFKPRHAALRALFYAIYFTHEPLAVLNVALAGSALLLGLARRDALHKEIAPTAFWVWVYVAATGLALYALLYRL
jgi:putative membrane protein